MGPHQPRALTSRAPRLDALFSVLMSSSQPPPDLPRVATVAFLGQEGDIAEPTRGPRAAGVLGAFLRSFCSTCSSPGPEGPSRFLWGKERQALQEGRSGIQEPTHLPLRARAGRLSSTGGRALATAQAPSSVGACVRACSAGFHRTQPPLFSEGQPASLARDQESPWWVPLWLSPGVLLLPGDPIRRPTASQPPCSRQEHSSGEVRGVLCFESNEPR